LEDTERAVRAGHRHTERRLKEVREGIRPPTSPEWLTAAIGKVNETGLSVREKPQDVALPTTEEIERVVAKGEAKLEESAEDPESIGNIFEPVVFNI
jgi:hypothetical protein